MSGDLDALLSNVARGRSASSKAKGPVAPVSEQEPAGEVSAPVGNEVVVRSGGRPVGRPSAPVGERWEDQNKRAAFYLSHDMLAQIDTVSAQVGISKSDLVRQAVAQWLESR